MSFASFHLHSRIMSGVLDAGWAEPMPIQRKAIPPVMEGRDVLGLAQTGSGKTGAFVLPILHRLIDGPRGHVRALVVAPTRELSEQINDAFRDLGSHTGLKSATIYGGVGFNPQIEALRGGADIVVACPGRLLDHVGRRTLDLAHVEVLVLDEADRMLDMGFLPDVRKILAAVPPKRQTLLFSATMPDEIRGLAHDVLRDPVTVQIGMLKPVDSVSHALYPVSQHLKTPLLMELLARFATESVLVFTRTKHRAKKVARQLEQAGLSVTSLQGNLSQNRRQTSIDGFRDGSYKIMVATDIASRGIDVTQISHVINYDMPDTVDAYTHRIGRTGRVSRTGDAFTLLTAEDEPLVRPIERALGEKIERRQLEGFDYRAPAPPKAEAQAGHRPPAQYRAPARKVETRHTFVDERPVRGRAQAAAGHAHAGNRRPETGRPHAADGRTQAASANSRAAQGNARASAPSQPGRQGKGDRRRFRPRGEASQAPARHAERAQVAGQAVAGPRPGPSRSGAPSRSGTTVQQPPRQAGKPAAPKPEYRWRADQTTVKGRHGRVLPSQERPAGRDRGVKRILEKLGWFGRSDKDGAGGEG